MMGTLPVGLVATAAGLTSVLIADNDNEDAAMFSCALKRSIKYTKYHNVARWSSG